MRRAGCAEGRLVGQRVPLLDPHYTLFPPELLVAAMISQESTSTTTFLKKLSALGEVDGSEWPSLCREVRRNQKGCEVCAKVCERLELIVTKQRARHRVFPFICCCGWGAKILVIPVGEDIFVALCRSPVSDYKLLDFISRQLGKTVDEVAAAWRQLPQFGARFAERVLGELKKQVDSDSFSGIAGPVTVLAQSYAQYEFDVAMYSTLGALAPKENGSVPAGAVGIVHASKPREKPVVRLVTREFGSERADYVLPILGLALDAGNVGDLSECLETEDVRSLSEELLSRPEWEFQDEDCDHRDGVWSAKVRFRFAADPGSKWREVVQRNAFTGVNVGSGTVLSPLEQDLDDENWEGLRERLARFVIEKDLYPWANDGKTVLLYQVLQDVAAATARLEVDSPSDRFEVCRQTLKDLLGTLGRYSLFAPGYDAVDGRAGLLAQDMSARRTEYRREMERGLIPWCLDDNDYSQEVVRRSLEIDREVTVAAMLTATSRRGISVGSDPGRAAWREVFRFCEDPAAEQEERDQITEQLFEAAAPPPEKRRVERTAQALGALWVLVTLGARLADPVIVDVRRNARKSYVEKQLASSD